MLSVGVDVPFDHAKPLVEEKKMDIFWESEHWEDEEEPTLEIPEPGNQVLFVRTVSYSSARTVAKIVYFGADGQEIDVVHAWPIPAGWLEIFRDQYSDKEMEAVNLAADQRAYAVNFLTVNALVCGCPPAEPVKIEEFDPKTHRANLEIRRGDYWFDLTREILLADRPITGWRLEATKEPFFFKVSEGAMANGVSPEATGAIVHTCSLPGQVCHVYKQDGVAYCPACRRLAFLADWANKSTKGKQYECFGPTNFEASLAMPQEDVRRWPDYYKLPFPLYFGHIVKSGQGNFTGDFFGVQRSTYAAIKVVARALLDRIPVVQ